MQYTTLLQSSVLTVLDYKLNNVISYLKPLVAFQYSLALEMTLAGKNKTEHL